MKQGVPDVVYDPRLEPVSELQTTKYQLYYEDAFPSVVPGYITLDVLVVHVLPLFLSPNTASTVAPCRSQPTESGVRHYHVNVSPLQEQAKVNKNEEVHTSQKSCSQKRLCTSCRAQHKKQVPTKKGQNQA